jgi:hypothetical protein
MNISGIYNYCDRWCERCFFTNRCAVYVPESHVRPEEKDSANRAFWRSLSINFEEAKKMLQEAAERFGIDLNALPAEALEKIKQNEERVQRKSKEHALHHLSAQYTELALDFLKIKTGLAEKQKEWIQKVTLDVMTEEEVGLDVSALKDCFEVIQWYSTFIHVKLIRAITGKLGDDGWEEENGFQRDFDGSAKVAMIAVERSIQAWSIVYEMLPHSEDNCLKALAVLQKIMALVEKEFPRAKDFIRPGFDDPSPG